MSTSPQPAQKGRLPLLRWLRQSRIAILFAFAMLAIWFMASTRPRKVSAFHEVFQKLERLENTLLDLRFKWRGQELGHPNIAILAIDRPMIPATDLPPQDLESSPALQRMTEKDFPWRRLVWSEVLDKLFTAGAKVVAFDIVFYSKNQDDPDFAASIAKYVDRVVLAMTVQNMATDIHQRKMEVMYPNAALIPPSQSGIYGCAVVHPETEDDETIRRIDHFTSDLRELGFVDSSNETPSLSALAVRKFIGKPLDDARQRQLIRYQGEARTYPYLPVSDLFIRQTYAGPLYRNGEIFRDKIVFIGTTYELAKDDKYTPFGKMAGVEVHAQAAADLLTGARLHEVSPRTGWWIMVFTTLASVGVVGWVRRAWAQVLGVLLLIFGFVFASHIAFSRYNLVFPMTAPVLGAALSGGFGFLLSFLLEQWEKAHTRKVLNRFVSKRIAAVVLKNAEEFEHARRGEKRPVAVFFSDIRSFTTWSENAAPENLVGQLNEYFERAVTHIEEREGNVQKFIGDAILAAWGDTHSNGFADDATRAVATALTMRVTLRALNAGWDKREDRIVISIGMGINHGDVVVGEVGHPERREYTVLGDGVNFAARLESATKQFHTDCLVGESVEVLTRDRFVYRHADFVRVKGKNKPVNIFIPLSDVTTPPPEWLADYHKARALYVERKFTEAAALFRAVNLRIGGDDFLCETYATRCDRYAQEPPPADWDGSYTLTEK